jgi:SAM-dependent methyltransferase
MRIMHADLETAKIAPGVDETSAYVFPWSSEGASVAIPDYLRDVYAWAYLNSRNVRLLDRDIVVSTILWGNNHRLQQAAFAEFEPGQTVLQSAHVYGDMVPNLARHLGLEGHLEAIDVAPIQVERCRRKLAGFPWARVRRADARDPGGGPYDGVCSYFLLHEMPDDYKRAVVDALLASVAPGGKVVFIDYHRPHWAHPLKWVTALVFVMLEPFAMSLWRHEIKDFASDAERYAWRTETYFGGLFQKVVAQREPL